jgi:hypothetical protein
MQPNFSHSVKALAAVRTLLLTAAVLVGPAHLTLFAQGCNKSNGIGAYVSHGTRYSIACSNSGFQNLCKWLDCNATVLCTLCAGNLQTCGPGTLFGNAYNDNCFVGFPTILCGCTYNYCCSGYTNT